jgi:hypothetical protein
MFTLKFQRAKQHVNLIARNLDNLSVRNELYIHAHTHMGWGLRHGNYLFLFCGII